MSYRCCDCGEIKGSKPEIESHINSDHIGWTPYQCFYCNQNGITTRKPSKSTLHDHVTERHPDQQFTYLYTDDETKNEHLKDMIQRSTIENVPAEVNVSPPALSISNAEAKSCASFLKTPSKMKTEVVDIINESQSSKSQESAQMSINDNDIITIDDDDDIQRNVEMKRHQDTIGNYRCETCRKVIPRNLMIIRDHIKVHFKEKTGCFPLDLSKLPHSLKQIYCKLLLASFPVVGASILENDMLTTAETVTKKKCEKHEVSEKVNNVAKSTNLGISHDCKQCGKQFEKLTSLNVHQRIWCKNKKVSETRKPDKSTGVSSLSKDLKSKQSLLHQSGKHKTADIQNHCNKCKINLGTESNITAKHILNFHMDKRIYECSLCKKSVQPISIKRHDLVVHKGQGKSSCIYNISQYKCEIEVLRKRLIRKVTDSKHSNHIASQKKILKPTIAKRTSHSNNEPWSPQVSGCGTSSIEIAKEKVNSVKSVTKVKCDVCSKFFPSSRRMYHHRRLEHGIPVQWHCKECKISVHDVKRHLLFAHLNKRHHYECSSCNKSGIRPGNIVLHDKTHHGGNGNAKLVRYSERYEKQLKELRKKFIIDANLTSTTVRTGHSSEQVINTVSSINHQKAIAMFGGKSVNRCGTIKCISRSQRHELSHPKRQVLKNHGFKKDFARVFPFAAHATSAIVVAPSMTAVSKVKSEFTEELLNNESNASGASLATEPSLTIEMKASETASSASKTMAPLIERDLTETERYSHEIESTVQTTETAQAGTEPAPTEDGQTTMSITESAKTVY